MATRPSCLPEGLPRPVPEADGLSQPYWEAARRGELRVQRCRRCRAWQWGPEWICHRCHGFRLGWEEVAPRGQVHSWIRVWHPTHSALRGKTPYVVVLVELPEAGGIRMVGNLRGAAPAQDSARDASLIGSPVRGFFEHHRDATPPFTLLQWEKG